MLLDAASLPDDLAAAHATSPPQRAARPAAASRPAARAAAHAMILAERAARREAEAAVSNARLEIERLKLLLAKARRAQYGQSSERGAKLVEQLELQLTHLAEQAAGEANG